MLQQTTVVTVIDYFHKFREAFPTVQDLAASPLDKVLHLWQGLGYYSRARNLHKCAQVLVREYQSVFPKTAVELEKLPGIGPYTAAAIASICFDEPAAIVDGNVIRVISRLFQVETPVPQSLPEVRSLAQALTPQEHAGDYAQAIMDLGATICRPKSPLCLLCPWQSACGAAQLGVPEDYPKKEKKAPLPQKYGVFFFYTHGQHFWAERRPEKGLLGGLMAFPSTAWAEDPLPLEVPESFAPYGSEDLQLFEKAVAHTFTHFKLTMQIAQIPVAQADPLSNQGQWIAWSDIDAHAWPTLMKKVFKVIAENYCVGA